MPQATDRVTAVRRLCADDGPWVLVVRQPSKMGVSIGGAVEPPGMSGPDIARFCRVVYDLQNQPRAGREAAKMVG
jgi:hypothetical protein